MKQFVIVTEGLGKVQADLLTSVFKGRSSYGFWHWIEASWFVTGPDDLTAKSLYLLIVAAAPSLNNCSIVVVGIGPPVTHWGRVKKEAWNWMANYFGIPK